MPIQQRPTDRFIEVPINLGLNQATFPSSLKRGQLTQATNVVHRRLGAVGKRTGSGPYGPGSSGSVTGNKPVISGTRWYRGRPSTLTQMIVQSNDTLWKGNDATGVFTSIGSLTASSTPAFFCSAYDPNGTTDILIVACGSMQPQKWDGTTFANLNAGITNKFTGCEQWHEHVWFWGDPNNPDTLYATDLGNPESFAFVNNFGGYQTGRGDGDPTIQRVIGNGERLLSFKTANIYVVSGYDFATGDYQFSNTPLVRGIGTPAPFSVARSRDDIVFWSGAQFYILHYGQSEPEPIGTPLINSMAKASQNSQTLIRAVAGDFQVSAANTQVTIYNDFYLCAVDVNGSGFADTILAYDRFASEQSGSPMWSVLSGLNIGCFVHWNGPGDQKQLYFGDAKIGQVNQFGQSPAADSAAAISTTITTTRDDGGTPDLVKWLDRIYLRVDSNNTTFNISIAAEGVVQTTVAQAFSGNAGGQAVFGQGLFGLAAFGVSVADYYQIAEAYVSPRLHGRNFQFTITESSASSVWEITGLSYHCIEEAPHNV